MGFDKPDLGFVVHLGAPASPVAYYQQIGRAGRAVERAEVVLLPGREDRDIWAYFASLAFPPEPLVRQTLRVLDAAGDEPLSTAAIETRVDLSRTRLEMLLKVLDADGAVRRVRGGWVGTGADWVYDEQRHRRIAEARRAEQQAMLDYLDTAGCRLAFLRRQLDDPDSGPDARCGRCDNCTGHGLEHRGRPGDPGRRRRAAGPARGRGARRASSGPAGWPSSACRSSGRIPAGELAEPGRVIGRLSDIGWGTRLRELVGDADAPDVPVPKDVLDACVRVLAGWGWAERPVGVVGIGSRSRPHQVAHLARRIAEIGRLPLLGMLRRSASGRPRTPTRRSGWARCGTASPSRELALPAGPVLLVDDVIDTGWTVTVAARLLRRAGATAVLPLRAGPERRDRRRRDGDQRRSGRPGRVDEHEPDLLPGPDLGGPVDVGVQHHRGHRVAAGDRVVGQEQHRLARRAGPGRPRGPCPRWAARRSPARSSRPPSSRIPTRSLRLDAVQVVAASARGSAR